MDNFELLAVLQKCENRLADALVSNDVAKEGYGLMLETLAHVRGLAEALAKRGENNPYAILYNIDKNEVTVEAKPAEPAPEPQAETFAPGGCDESESAPEPEQKPITPAPKPKPALTKQDMVTTLSYYAGDKGGNVDVFGIMQKHGWQNLSAVPKEEYQTLLDEVKAAAGVE